MIVCRKISFCQQNQLFQYTRAPSICVGWVAYWSQKKNYGVGASSAVMLYMRGMKIETNTIVSVSELQSKVLMIHAATRSAFIHTLTQCRGGSLLFTTIYIITCMCVWMQSVRCFYGWSIFSGLRIWSAHVKIIQFKLLLVGADILIRTLSSNSFSCARRNRIRCTEVRTTTTKGGFAECRSQYGNWGI
jgi:hypothetical protein